MYWATCGTSSTMSRRVWSLGCHRPTIPRAVRSGLHPEVPGRRRPDRSGLDRDEDRRARCRGRAARGRSRRRAPPRAGRRPRRTPRSSSAETRRSRSRRTQRRGGSPCAPSSKIVVRAIVPVAASCVRRAGLGHESAGLRVGPRPLQDDPAVVAGEVLGVRQPDVHGGHARPGPGASASVRSAARCAVARRPGA